MFNEGDYREGYKTGYTDGFADGYEARRCAEKKEQLKESKDKIIRGYE